MRFDETGDENKELAKKFGEYLKKIEKIEEDKCWLYKKYHDMLRNEFKDHNISCLILCAPCVGVESCAKFGF